MKITAIGRQLSVRDSMRELAEKKLSKFDRFFGEDAEAVVKFSVVRDKERVEVTILYNGTFFRSEEENSTFANALDCAVEALERQIRKNKTRLEKRVRENAFDSYSEDADAYEETDFDIRVKTFPFKPMAVEEAIMQMNLLEHQFFCFINSENEKTCVVYKRKNGGYGLIIPE